MTPAQIKKQVRFDTELAAILCELDELMYKHRITAVVRSGKKIKKIKLRSDHDNHK